MKKTVLLLCEIILVAAKANAQLPPAAQILYDSAYAQDSTLVNFAISNGAQAIATPDGNSFYVQWFPTNAVPNATPLVVTLHGSNCNAFMEFKSWYPRAQVHGCGIIALQWNRYNPHPPYDYFPDDTLYSYLDSALHRLNYPSGKALLHGFSRGSARSYAMIFKDIQSGNNYFCTTMSNSGDADTSYPLYDSITNGFYGPNIFAGKHWDLFCGGMDTIVGCTKMNNTQSWLQAQGATVDIFIHDPALGHDGFQLASSFAYKDSILDNYLQCYNGTLGLSEAKTNNEIHVAPNPFSSQAILQSDISFQNAVLIIYNCFGESVLQLKNIQGKSITIGRANLPGGIYFVRIIEGNKIYTDKIIITGT